MDSDCVIVVVYVEKQLWDRFIILCDGISYGVVSVKERIEYEELEKNYSCGDGLWLNPTIRSISTNEEKRFLQRNAFKISVKMNGHALSYLFNILNDSSTYRKLVINHLKHKRTNVKKFPDKYSFTLLKIHLVDVNKQIIDKGWNDRISYLVAEQCELGHAMSWLSTLGGAFSALGDYYIRCAEIAGHISLEQWRIALRLGDPCTVARCRLFSALSLMQTGHLSSAKQIIWKQYHAIKSGEYGQEPDIKLIRMCHGVWAKLRYEYQQRRQKRTRKALHWKT